MNSKMSEINDEYINNIIDKLAVQNNLTEYCYSRTNFEAIAQNYFGVLVPVVISAKRNREDINLHVVLKVAPTDKRYRVSGALTIFFLREIYVYSSILVKYNDLQQFFPQSSKFITPDCYYTCKEYCNEVIAIQNMCKDGYKPFTCDSFLDYEHIKISLESLARFHALSFIMKEKDSKVYDEAEKICVPLTEASNKRFLEILKDRLDKAVVIFENTKYVSLLKSLRENCTKIVESACNLVLKTCICHGDIWKENILFKYEDNKPVSACIIDYQTARMASPAFDTLYLIISSTDSNLRHKYFKELLSIYYHTFSQILKEGGLDSQVYTKDNLESDLRAVGPTCFIIANTSHWLSNGLQQEGHVRSKHVWTTEEEKKQALNRYKTIIKDIIDDFVDYGHLQLC